MVASNLLADVLALPPAERLELFDRLRESLLNDPSLHQLSEEQKRVLDERLDDYESDPTGGRDWDAVEADLLAKLGGTR